MTMVAKSQGELRFIRLPEPAPGTLFVMRLDDLAALEASAGGQCGWDAGLSSDGDLDPLLGQWLSGRCPANAYPPQVKRSSDGRVLQAQPRDFIGGCRIKSARTDRGLLILVARLLFARGWRPREVRLGGGVRVRVYISPRG